MRAGCWFALVYYFDCSPPHFPASPPLSSCALRVVFGYRDIFVVSLIVFRWFLMFFHVGFLFHAVLGFFLFALTVRVTFLLRSLPRVQWGFSSMFCFLRGTSHLYLAWHSGFASGFTSPWERCHVSRHSVITVRLYLQAIILSP